MKDNFPPQQPPLVVNGREYPMWSQFVHRKAEWIGGVLEDHGDSMDRRIFGGKVFTTEIVDILLEPNGDDGACFSVKGKDFTCLFDVKYGGVTGGDPGWITFSGYGGHTWRIKQRDKNTPKPGPPPELPLT